MTSQTSEKAFEATVESMLVAGGWQKGDTAEWDVERALFPARVVAFLQAAQPELWNQLAAQHGGNLETMVVDQLVKQLDIKGTLGVLRQGFKFQGKTLRLAFFKPAPRPQPRCRGTVRPERTHCYPSGSLSPRQERHHRHAVRSERGAGGDLRTEEPDDGADVAERHPPVQGDA